MQCPGTQVIFHFFEGVILTTYCGRVTTAGSVWCRLVVGSTARKLKQLHDPRPKNFEW